MDEDKIKNAVSEFKEKKKSIEEKMRKDYQEKINTYIDIMLSDLPERLEEALKCLETEDFILYRFQDGENHFDRNVKMIAKERSFLKEFYIPCSKKLELIYKKLKEIGLEDIFCRYQHLNYALVMKKINIKSDIFSAITNEKI